MPLYSIQGPDGKTYEIEGPEGATREQVIAAIQSRLAAQPQEEPKKQAGLIGSFMESAALPYKIAAPLAAYKLNPTQETREAVIKAAESEYGPVQEGDHWEGFWRLLGTSLGAEVSPLVAGSLAGVKTGGIATAAAAPTGPAAPLIGALAGITAGTAAYTGVKQTQYTESNLLRQAQETQERANAGEAVKDDPSLSKAFVAAAGQTALDLAGAKVYAPLFRMFPFLKGMAGPGEEAAIMADAIKNGSLKVVGGGVAKGVGKGVAFEVPQEVAQQAMERWQAGLSLTDDDAKSEYLQAAQGAAVLGGFVGGVSGAVETVPAVSKVRAQQKEDRDEITRLEELADAKRTTEAAPQAEIDRPANEVLTNGAERDALEPPSITPQADNVEGAGVAGDISAGSGSGVPDNGGDVRLAGDAATPDIGAVDGGGLGEVVSPVEPVNEGAAASDDPVAARESFPSILALNDAVEQAPVLYPKSAVARKFFINGVKEAIGQAHGANVEALRGVRKDAFENGKNYAAFRLAELKKTAEETTPALTEATPTSDSAEELARLKRIQDRYAAAGKGQEFDPNKSLMEQMMPQATRGARPAEPDIEPTNISEEDVKPSGPNLYADDIEYDPAFRPAVTDVEFSDNPVIARGQALKLRKDADNLSRRGPKGETQEQANERIAKAARMKEVAANKLAELRGGQPEKLSPVARRLVEERGLEEAIREMERAYDAAVTGARYYTRNDRPVPGGTALRLENAKKDLAALRSDLKAMKDEALKVPESLESLRKEAKRIRDKIHREQAAGGPTAETIMRRDAIRKRIAELEAAAKPVVDETNIDSVRGEITRLQNAYNYDVSIGRSDPKVAEELARLKAVREKLKAENPTQKKGWPKGVKRPHRTRKELDDSGLFFDDLVDAPETWSTQELMKHVRDIELTVRNVTRGWTGAPDIFVVSEPKTNAPKLKVYERGRAQEARTELPAPVYARMAADGRLNAPALTTEDGTVYIIASNIPKGYAYVAKPIIFHEVLGHAGLAKQFGEEKDKLLYDIYRTNAKYRAKADKWLKEHQDAYSDAQTRGIVPFARALNEVMANEVGDVAFKNTPTWERIKSFIRRWVRKIFNKDLPFSDKDVEAVMRLSSASIRFGAPTTRAQTARTLDKESVGVESALYAPNVKGPKKKTIQNRIKRARERAAKLEDVISKSNPDETLDVAGELMKSMRGSKESIDRLKSVWSDTTVDRIKTILPVMTTDDITRWVGDRINNLKPINNAVTAMGAYRFNWRQDAAPLMEDWVSYYQSDRKAANELADNMHRATILQVDPSAHSDAKNYIANDTQLTELQAKKKAAKNASAAGRVDSEIFQRQEDIKLMYEFWGKMDPKAKEIFARTRDYYKKQFDEYMSLLKGEVDKTTDGETKDKLNKKIQDMFASAKELEVYFPLRRYGKYWYQFGTGENREFYMFDSAHQRNTAMRDRLELAKKGGDARGAEKMIEDGDLDLGSSSRQAMAKEAGSSKILSDMFKLIDGAQRLDKDAMKEQVFTLYMNTLPNNSMRQNLRKRKTIAGFSRDALRNYVTSVNSASNQMAKLKYSSDIRNGILSARDEIKNNPDKDKLGAFVEEIDKRAELELVPDLPEEGEIDWNGLATMGNQAVFYYMLTSPKSAIVQMTQLHIVGLPVLSAKYGLGKTMKMAAKYGNPLFSIGVVKDGKMAAPSVSLSKAITEEKNAARKADLKEGWEHANKLDKFMDTFVASTTERGKMSSATHASVGQTALRRVANFMSGAFHHLERISREIMYMSAFELEYDAQLAAGKSRPEAVEAAKETAVNQLEEALFNYSSYNKPRLAKTPLGKLGFQFMSYPMQMTSYLVRNFAALTRNLPAAEKKAAAIKFFGTIGMTSMYAGVVGLPGYALIMGVADGLKNLFGDPGDDEMDNPLAAHNTDIWFRQYFIPTYFGAGVVGRAVTYGPVSAITGGDISGSTSLDGLWLRNDNPPESYKDGFQQMLLGLTGPFGSMGSQVAAGFDDINNGDFVKGMEKLSPAFLRNFIKTGRYASEGYVTKGNPGDTIREKEWFTTGKLLGQSMGFTPMEIADIQQKTYALKREAEVIVSKQAKLLDRINRAYAKGDDAEIDRVLEAIDKYNDKYWQVLPITADSLNSSLKNRLAVQAASIQGLRVNGKFRPAAEELLSGSLEEE